jgi:hypothetical protein
MLSQTIDSHFIASYHSALLPQTATFSLAGCVAKIVIPVIIMFIFIILFLQLLFLLLFIIIISIIIIIIIIIIIVIICNYINDNQISNYYLLL